MKMFLHALGTTLLLSIASSASADPPKIVMEEFMVSSPDPNIRLYVRNKHPESLKAVPAEQILLFVHGATYPAETTFDLRLNGLSWMEYIAQRGYDVYLVDMPGYGRSTRPVEMDVPAEQNEPIVRSETELQDVGAAVDFILKRRKVQKLNLMGWSWGTVIMGWYTAQHNDRVVKLVLGAPAWLGSLSPSTDRGKLGAYDTITREDAKAGWLADVPEYKKADLIPAGWFEAWADATFTTDPVGAALVPPVLRAPLGYAADQRELISAGKALPYDPAEIRVPTFLVHAEWDFTKDMARSYFEKLVNTPYKRYVEIGEGTHFVLMEKNRIQLFQAVQQFLDEKSQIGQ